MYTRVFNKMTADDIQGYLDRGGNTIFVAVGVVEVHGAMPVDVEQMVPEGIALAMAEKADGLALTGLPFFFPGGTIISPATVQVSVRESIDRARPGEALCGRGLPGYLPGDEGPCLPSQRHEPHAEFPGSGRKDEL